MIKALLALIIGLTMLVIGGYSAINSYTFIHNSELTTGQIIGFKKIKNQKRFIHYPIVKFTTEDNQLIEFKSGIANSLFKSYQLNQIVPVRYLANQPQQADIDDFASNWLLALILSILGTMCLIFGLISYYDCNKKRLR